ncbi:MAG: hypothetical protein J6M05_01820, partial [Cardiobacteriaceae bacterium]|nr:hypothetical protein [Cardiobacteriaceae bacterium]
MPLICIHSQDKSAARGARVVCHDGQPDAVGSESYFASTSAVICIYLQTNPLFFDTADFLFSTVN